MLLYVYVVYSVATYIYVYIYIKVLLYMYLGFPCSLAVKSPLAIQEMWVRLLGQEDPLEKEMATHSSILAWEIPWTEELGGLQSMGSHKNWT